MGKLLNKIEFIIILIANIACVTYVFFNGYSLISTVGEYNIITGIVMMILSVESLALPYVYYKLYKLVEK